MAARNIQIGQILLEAKLITPAQLEEALRSQKKDPRKLGDILVECGFITDRQLMKALEKHFNVPYVDLAETKIDSRTPGLISEDLARKHNVIPVSQTGRQLTVATSDPMNFYALDDVRLATNMDIRVVLSQEADIRNAIARYYSSKDVEEAAARLSLQYNASIPGATEGTEERVDNAPVVRLVSTMIAQAVHMGASDIHIEPRETETRVRMRIDGMLQDQMTLAAAAHPSIITRLKIMGSMNIAERRIPQDGRVESVVDGKAVDMRLSVLPTVTGEKIVIRILGGTGSVMSIDELGLSAPNRTIFNEILKKPSGIILVSGPTGSGKTTTLYSILGSLNRPESNIITVEDPVEYRIAGINQVQVNTKAGLTFASGLRSILRQDPDIIMVGEIRDDETAQIAVRAAITGHLVLSTIHTNDTASTISRLVNMGVEPYLVSSAVNGIVAQRLVRRICPRCSAAYEPGADERHLLGIEPGVRLHRGQGCVACGNTGYKGRVAVHEIMLISRQIRSLIDEGAPVDTLRDAAEKAGTVSLQGSCRELVLNGVTTVDELLRAAYSAV